jgi:hypothetical protein
VDARNGEREAAYLVEGEVWLHAGAAGWHFVTMPPDVADDVRARSAASRRPFGTVPARVTLGYTTWSTSLFAYTRSGSYLLPIKAAVLRQEGIAEGDLVSVRLELRDRR